MHHRAVFVNAWRYDETFDLRTKNAAVYRFEMRRNLRVRVERKELDRFVAELEL